MSNSKKITLQENYCVNYVKPEIEKLSDFIEGSKNCAPKDIVGLNSFISELDYYIKEFRTMENELKNIIHQRSNLAGS